MAGLQWAARRMGPITATLDVSYRSFTGAPSEEKGDSFINAFSGLAIAQLKNLTCFTYSPFEYLEEVTRRKPLRVGCLSMHPGVDP